MKSGNLNFLEPSGPLQACNGTALPLPLPFMHSHHILHKEITDQIQSSQQLADTNTHFCNVFLGMKRKDKLTETQSFYYVFNLCIVCIECSYVSEPVSTIY